jgi:hypothetical protein
MYVYCCFTLRSPSCCQPGRGAAISQAWCLRSAVSNYSLAAAKHWRSREIQTFARRTGVGDPLERLGSTCEGEPESLMATNGKEETAVLLTRLAFKFRQGAKEGQIQVTVTGIAGVEYHWYQIRTVG